MHCGMTSVLCIGGFRPEDVTADAGIEGIGAALRMAAVSTACAGPNASAYAVLLWVSLPVERIGCEAAQECTA